MRNLALALLLAPALLGANQAHALNLCARIDKATGEPREGASIKLRSQCRDGETAIGSTEEFAMIRENRADIDAALINSEPERIAAFRPAAIAKATNGCGLMVTNDGAFFEKCNVHVRSGSGATNGTVNSLGNLIVGYDESNFGDDRNGSHNLVVGMYHSYASFGGFIAGFNNTVSDGFSSVSGGQDNLASGGYSSISGGKENTASANSSSVSGGQSNTASDFASSVSGGRDNEARNYYASVLGGIQNTASGYDSSVSGGVGNLASGEKSSVSGGIFNTASTLYSIAP